MRGTTHQLEKLEKFSGNELMEPADCSMATIWFHVYGHHSYAQGAPTRQTPGAGFVMTDPLVGY